MSAETIGTAFLSPTVPMNYVLTAQDAKGGCAASVRQ